jgi:phenylacetic acid degradation operon negative regulatory protein
LRAQVSELTADLGVAPYVDQFRGAYLGPSAGPELAARVWQLDRLGVVYREFLARWTPVLTESGQHDDARAFVLRFSLIHEYQRFFLEDPDLPPDLTPTDWPGRAAADLFERLHERLRPAADRFFDTVAALDMASATGRGMRAAAR